MSKPRKRRSVRLPNIPMMPELRDQFGMQMHTALVCLDRAPSADAFGQLAEVFNVVQVAIEHDARRTHEARLINGGANALLQVQARVCKGIAPQPHETAPIQIAVRTIDSIMGKIAVTSLFTAIQKLKALDRNNA